MQVNTQLKQRMKEQLPGLGPKPTHGLKLEFQWNTQVGTQVQPLEKLWRPKHQTDRLSWDPQRRDRMIERETVEVSEHPKDTTLKVIDEDAEAIQASPSSSMPNHVGVVEPKGMPELEDTGPEEVLGEEPLVAVSLADGTIDLEDAPPQILFTNQT